MGAIRVAGIPVLLPLSAGTGARVSKRMDYYRPSFYRIYHSLLRNILEPTTAQLFPVERNGGHGNRAGQL